jgi:DNA polymerase
MTPADLKILVLDYETVWGDEYTLSKMTTEEYVRDPRFHAFGMSWKWFGGAPAQWVTHADLPAFYASIDWKSTAVLAHNAAFDIAILSWVYGCRPAYIFDSLSMARALFSVEQGNSLAKLAARFGLPPKGTAVNSTKNLLTIPPHVEAELAEYCNHDTTLCELIFTQLYVNAYGQCNLFPKNELDLIDLTMKMYTNPVLRLDVPLLEAAKAQDAARLEDLLTRTKTDEKDLASNEKFADLLAALGAEVPIKISKQTGKPAPALAKTDVEFQALVNSDNEDVALLCEARLRVKSTLERTRAQRFLDIASRGTLPVPLNYYGASTGRWSAAKQGINLQNLKRGSFLRDAIQAPPGHVLVVGDLSQIEPRVLAWYAGFDLLLDTFRSGEDAYAVFGAQMFGIPGLNKREHPLLRQSAKSALLGCGYGLGWPNMASQLLGGFLGAPPQRYDMAFFESLGLRPKDLGEFVHGTYKGESNQEVALRIPHTCSDEQMLVHCCVTRVIIDRYRAAAKPVPKLWGTCKTALEEVLSVEGEDWEYKGLTFLGARSDDPTHTARIMLPNGMAINYQELCIKEGQFIYGAGTRIRKIYGSKTVENLVQAVARIVCSDGMRRVQKRYPVVHCAHDELVCVAPEKEAEEALAWVLQQMTREPRYLRGIPLAAEGGFDVSYGKAKK